MEKQKVGNIMQDAEIFKEYLALLKEKYEGKYFKMRFGEGWMVYLKVEKIIEELSCKGVIIEISKKEGLRVVINTEDMPYNLSQFTKEISKEEFIEAFKLAVKEIFRLDLLPITNYKHIKHE